MSIKSLVLASSLALAMGAAHADSGSFSSNSASSSFLVTADVTGTLSGSVVSAFVPGAGYDITSVTVGGSSFSDVVGYGADVYSFSIAVVAGMDYAIKIKGQSYGGSPYVAAWETTPVPEPESYALAIAGLGVAGVLTRRRLG